MRNKINHQRFLNGQMQGVPTEKYGMSSQDFSVEFGFVGSGRDLEVLKQWNKRK